MQKYKEFLLKILEIIRYSDNREEFADNFLSQIHLQSLSSLARTLNPQNQDKLKEEVKNSSNSEELSKNLKNYFSEEQIQKAISEATADAMSRYIETINSTLSENQKEKLLILSVNLKQKNL